MKDQFRRIYFDGLLYLTNRVIARIPSHTLRLWFYRNVMQFKIESHSFIFMDAWFDCKCGFSMGKNSVINQRCRLDNRGGIQIGENASISSDVIILTADHDPASKTFAGRTRKVIIEDYVFVGTRALILPGVKVGKGAVIAAGSVVSKNVPEYAIVAGCPAKEISTRSRELDYQTNYNRLFF